MVAESIAKNLIWSDKGFWTSNLEIETISYTEDGHNKIQSSEGSSFWFHHRLKCIGAVIDKFGIVNLLDIGGGNGEVSRFLKTKNINTVLLEPSVYGCLNAVKQGVSTVIQGTPRSVDFKDESISAIGLFDVLEHIEGDKSYLKDLYQMLEVDGKLVLTVPAYQFLFSDFDKMVGHFRRYTLRELKRKLIETGFTIDYGSYLFSLLPIPIALTRLIFSRKYNQGKGHINRQGVVGKILEKLLSPELIALRLGVRIPLGSSCIIVATKKPK